MAEHPDIDREPEVKGKSRTELVYLSWECVSPANIRVPVRQIIPPTAIFENFMELLSMALNVTTSERWRIYISRPLKFCSIGLFVIMSFGLLP